jgi:glycosyltransferase involved in cell wall biosynthesis
MLKRTLKALLTAVGLKVVKVNTATKGNIGKVGCLEHKGTKQGNVLLSYIIEPFLLKKEEAISNAHHHDWLSWQIGLTFSSLGYDVDVIHYLDRKFVPKKSYDYLIGARTNFQRLAELMPAHCIKIVHLDTAHWIFNNSADYQRHLELQQRRGLTLNSFKWVEPNWAIEFADYATTNWGNQFNIGTYQYAGKPIFQIPLPTCAVYPKPANKDYETCNNHFLWFGSDGLIHKGLDLVLEAFAQMPECRLTVCGPIRKSATENTQNGPLQHDRQFEAAFHRELYESKNIFTEGWVDIESETFQKIADQCIGVVFPSCSEGGGASVITCMQAGLIPIVSFESNVEVGDFGVTLRSCSIEEIKRSVRQVCNMPATELKTKAHKAWQFCRTHHTRDSFTENYNHVIKQIMSERTKKSSDAIRLK